MKMRSNGRHWKRLAKNHPRRRWMRIRHWRRSYTRWETIP